MKARARFESWRLSTLTIFGQRDHGALLAIAGLSADPSSTISEIAHRIKMTRHHLSAGLYAPIRILLREDDDGVSL